MMNAARLRRSLRVRLLAGTIFWIVVSLAVAGWGLGSLFRHHVALQFHAELRTHLDQLTANMALDGQQLSVASMSDPRFNRPFSGLYWQVDRAAAVLARSRSLWDKTLMLPVHTIGDGEVHQERIAGPEGAMLGVAERTVSIDGQSLRLIVAADERLMMEPVARFNRALWLALAVLGLGLSVAALMQVLVGLAPLRQLQRSLARVRSGEAPRMEGKFPTEILPLVDEFNTVLGQNAEVVERARTQAGNLAHALKTPLAVLANAVHGRDDELARLVAAQVDTARAQVDRHLKRARAAAAARLPGARTPVGPVVDGLVRTMRRIHIVRNLEIAAGAMGDVAFRGEEHDLQEMLGNLMDNACKWARSRVAIDAGIEAGWLVIRCDDDGPGIAAGQREVVMRRGFRADEFTPGTGLGLGIVDDLARMYQGRVDLSQSALGGLRATLVLPIA